MRKTWLIHDTIIIIAILALIVFMASQMERREDSPCQEQFWQSQAHAWRDSTLAERIMSYELAKQLALAAKIDSIKRIVQ